MEDCPKRRIVVFAQLKNNRSAEPQVPYVERWEAAGAEGVICRDDFQLRRRMRRAALLFAMPPNGEDRVGSEQGHMETPRGP